MGRTLAASATLAGVLLLSPNAFIPQHHHDSQHSILMPPSSYAESVLEQVKTPTAKQEEISVLDEVWNLVGKYYIDRSFNGQVRRRFDSIYYLMTSFPPITIIIHLTSVAFLYCRIGNKSRRNTMKNWHNQVPKLTMARQ
jgi:hypothetical protein